jgi:hypothetical protein
VKAKDKLSQNRQAQGRAGDQGAGSHAIAGLMAESEAAADDWAGV